MKGFRVITILFHLLLMVLLTPAQSFAEKAPTEAMDNAVLVYSSDNPMPRFTSKELRLLYLGYTVTKDDQTYQAIINESDPVTYNQFLQKIMHMTDRQYKRQLVSRVFRFGGQKPLEFDQIDLLLRHLKTHANSVTFMMPETVRKLGNIKIIQPLW